MAGINNLSASLQANQSWSAANTLTGSNYSPISNSGRISKSVSYSSGTPNASLGGADELISYQFSVSASSSANVDLTSLTDILATAGVSLARVKGYCFRLLNVTDDPVFGTAAASMTWGNAASNAQPLNLAGTAPTFTVYTGGVCEYADLRAGGFIVDSTHKILKFLNNDAGLAAEIQVTVIGGTS